MSNFIQADPNQPLLLPIDLREWVPADDMVHFILEAVEQVPLAHFQFNVRGRGSKRYHPRVAKLKAKLEAARDRLAVEVKARAACEQADYERKVAARDLGEQWRLARFAHRLVD